MSLDKSLVCLSTKYGGWRTMDNRTLFSGIGKVIKQTALAKIATAKEKKA